MAVKKRAELREEKQKRYRKFLEDLGFSIDEVDDNVVYFKHEDLFYSVMFESVNDGFVGVRFAVAVDDIENKLGQLEVVNYIGSTYKIMKCFYDDAGVVLSCEGFVASEEEFKRLVRFSVSSMSYAYDELCEKFPSAV